MSINYFHVQQVAEELGLDYNKLSEAYRRLLSQAVPPVTATPTESIMDADGLPRLMAQVIRTSGDPEALQSLYAFINTWADKRVAATPSEAVKERVEALNSARDHLVKVGRAFEGPTSYARAYEAIGVIDAALAKHGAQAATPNGGEA